MADDSDYTAARTRELQRAEADIVRHREQLALSVTALRQEMSRMAHWREWVRRKPLPFLGGAFFLGLWFGHRR